MNGKGGSHSQGEDICKSYTAGPQIKFFLLTSFHYNVDEMPEDLNSHLDQLAYDKTDFVIHHFTTVPRPY